METGWASSPSYSLKGGRLSVTQRGKNNCLLAVKEIMKIYIQRVLYLFTLSLFTLFIF